MGPKTQLLRFTNGNKNDERRHENERYNWAFFTKHDQMQRVGL